MEEIERGALDSGVPLADTLRKCIALGGRAGSSALRDWATKELNGYVGPKDEVPDYRHAVAPIVIDGFTFSHHITGELISAHDLPDVVRESGISEDLAVVPGVGELEEMVRSSRSSNEGIKLGLPGGAEIARIMTYELQGKYRAVERVYWNVSPIAIAGVLDQIRTRLVSLIAEVRAESPNPAAPEAAAINNAVEVVVYGKARDVNVHTAQSGGGPALAPPTSKSPWWKSVWAILVGLATIAAAVFAWLQWN